MKKIFSFLTLLLLTCSMAWAGSKTYTFDDDVELATDWTVTYDVPEGGTGTCAITNSLNSFPLKNNNFLGFSYLNKSGISITIESTASYSDITGLSFDVVANDNSKPNFSAYIVDNNGDVIETLFETYGLKNDFGNPGTNKWGAYSNNSIASKSGHLKIVTTASSSGKYAALDNICITYGPISYTVTYDANGATSGDVPTDANSPYESGATVTVIGNTGNLAKTNATFNGWNTAADGSGTAYNMGGTFAITANTTLYAQWEEEESGDVVLLNWKCDETTTIGETNGTTSGGTVTLRTSDNNKSWSTENATYNANVPSDMKGTTSKELKSGGNALYLEIALTSGTIQKGDIIYVSGYNGWAFSTSNGFESIDVVTIGTTGSGKGDVNVGYATITSDINVSTIYARRAAGTGTGIAAIKIVRPAPSTDPTIAADDASIIATESGVTVNKNIAVTGVNLTGSTLTATLNPAVPGLSVALGSSTITDGSISTNAVLSYSQTINTNGTTTLTLSDGTTEKEVTITYRAFVVYRELQSVNTITTWDFSKIARNQESDLSGDNGIRLSGGTFPSISTELVYEDYASGYLWTIAEGFDGTTIAFTGQYPTRNDNMCQNGTLHIKTTVAGILVVDFSDTGNSGDSYERYLNINGNNTAYYTMRTGSSNDRKTVSVAVAAGDIYIKGMKDDGETAAAICVYSLKFTPTEITLGANGYSTYAADFKYTVSGAEVYKAAYNGSNAVVLTEVENAVVPANQGIILKGTEGATATITLSNDDASDFSGNGLIGVVAPLAASAGMYVLSTNAGVTEFNPCQAGVMIPAHKAYISIPSNAPAVRIIVAENGATGINELEGAEKAVKFIENGKLYIQKDGVVYDAMGKTVR